VESRSLLNTADGSRYPAGCPLVAAQQLNLSRGFHR